MQIQVNGKPHELPAPITVRQLLQRLGLDTGHVAVAVGDDVVRREAWDDRLLQPGDQVEVVRAVGGGAPGPAAPVTDRWQGYDNYDPAADPLIIAGHRFTSRLFCGTGKFRTAAEMQAAHARAGTEMVTVAIRYMDFAADGGGDILRHLDLNRFRLLPNTAGAYTVQDAVKMARLAREATGTNWIKLEVIGDPQTLLPDLQGTIEATRILVQDGFVVLPYTTADLITCLRLEEAGAAAVMPLASPIGSGQGLIDWVSLRRVVERVSVPVVVDAGIGAPADAAMAMEMGAEACLINTAIARAANPPLMAEAMRLAIIAGRAGLLAGRIPKTDQAAPSSPTTGVPTARQPGEVE